MTLNGFCEYIRNPLATAKARVVLLPPGDTWTALRRFYEELGGVELRVSDLVKETAWLPMPDEVFERVRDAMTAPALSGKTVVLLGMSGYLALLKEEHRRTAIAALREWVDNVSGSDTICLLRNEGSTKAILKEVFTNPRYRSGKQLIEIVADQPSFEGSDGRADPAEVMLVEAKLVSLIPEACDTFHKYLRYTEEHPSDSSVRRIVVASEGRELAGLSAEVKQVVCLRDFARVFYSVDDRGLSDGALRWMCERGKNGFGQTLLNALKTVFFAGSDVLRHVLRVFDSQRGAGGEALLWLLKNIAPAQSYLKCVLAQVGITTINFRSAYVTGAVQCLDKAPLYADERRDAILESGILVSDTDIRQFIKCCKPQSTSLVAPWLNCGTAGERTELLRRCASDGILSKAVKDVYPEAAAYMNSDNFFENASIEEYFRDYRQLKITNRVTPDFFLRAASMSPCGVPSRDAILQQYALDDKCALLVVDAMGAEWLPMLVTVAQGRNLGVDLVKVGQTQLPTSTAFNQINWSDEVRRLPDIKKFDNIAHNGVELHELRPDEENLAEALAVIGSVVIQKVIAGLAQFERVLVTADHGSSRLAFLAWDLEPRLARTLECEDGADIANSRYRERAEQGMCPSEMEETLDGRFWVVRGYDRLPKKGGGRSFELHGGATLEERLVPVVVFSKAGQFEPKAKVTDKRVLIVEKDDFDI